MTRVISRSGHEAYCRCPRKHYYRYLYKKTGYDTYVPSLPLLIGLATHMGLEILLRSNGDLDEALRGVKEEWNRMLEGKEIEDNLAKEINEGKRLTDAFIIGWRVHRYEDFIRDFEIISIEEEVPIWLSTNILLATRADVIVRERASGLVYVFNWKTSSSYTDWTASWMYDIQMWTEAFAIESKLKEPVQGCIVEGFYKGIKRGDSFGTPLLYGYEKKIGDKGVYQWETPTGKGARTDWEKIAIEGKDLLTWISMLPKEAIDKCFLRSEPIDKNDDVVEDWIRQVTRREMDIKYILDNGDQNEQLDFFWQNFSKMECKWCPYVPVCKKVVEMDELIDAGVFVERVDHHPLEGG